MAPPTLRALWAGGARLCPCCMGWGLGRSTPPGSCREAAMTSPPRGDLFGLPARLWVSRAEAYLEKPRLGARKLSILRKERSATAARGSSQPRAGWPGVTGGGTAPPAPPVSQLPWSLEVPMPRAPWLPTHRGF